MADYALERGALNYSLNGLTGKGTAQGDNGFKIGLVMAGSRGFEDNWLGLQIDITGGPATVTVTLLGSLDDVNYYTIQTYPATTGGLYFVSGFVARYVQCVLTALTGGASPTVKASVTQ